MAAANPSQKPAAAAENERWSCANQKKQAERQAEYSRPVLPEHLTRDCPDGRGESEHERDDRGRPKACSCEKRMEKHDDGKCGDQNRREFLQAPGRPKKALRGGPMTQEQSREGGSVERNGEKGCADRVDRHQVPVYRDEVSEIPASKLLNWSRNGSRVKV